MIRRRILAAVLALAAFTAAGAGSVRAAGPTLGATVESHLYADEDRSLDVLNRSTILATFTFEPSGAWVVEPSALTLAPNQYGAVQVVRLGANGAPLRVIVRAAHQQTIGVQRGEIAFDAWLFTARPFDWLPWVLLAAVCLMAGVALVVRTLDADTLELTKARRYLELRWGELLGPGKPGPQSSHASEDSLAKDDRHRFRALAALRRARR